MSKNAVVAKPATIAVRSPTMTTPHSAFVENVILPSLKTARRSTSFQKAGSSLAQGAHYGVPMHPGDIARPLLKKILKDVGLTEEEFRNLL